MHGDSSFAQRAVNDAEAETVEYSQENALAFEETGVGPPAQPGFAAGIAEKPPHPAKGAGGAGCCEIRERRHSLRKPCFAL
jgi:hypothetical protein